MSKAKASDSSDSPDGSAEERIIAIVWRWFPVVVALGTAAAGRFLGAGFGILVLAAGAFIAAIASIWGSVRSLFGEVPLAGEDAFALGAPSAEEEQKRAIIRAIKDLEFEHNVGKISDQDYDTLIVKYRAEAKRLLRVLDNRAAPARAEAEKLADAHLKKRGIDRTPPKPVHEPPPDDDVDEDDEADEPSDDAENASVEGGADDDDAKDDADDDEDDADADDDDADDAEEEDDAEEDDADEEDADEEDAEEEDAEEDDADDEDDEDDADDEDDEDDADDDEDDADEEDDRIACAKCGTRNESDAAFCKKCASKLSARAGAKA